MKPWHKIIDSSAFPEEGHEALERVLPRLKKMISQNTECETLLNIFGNSRFLTQFFERYPEIDTDLISESFLKKKKNYSSELKKYLKGNLTKEEFKRKLRLYKYRHYLRIIARDLSPNIPSEEIGQELSDLASACLDASLEWAIHKEISKEEKSKISLCSLGMGKLGGQDLNVSSDIDLIYFYEAEDRNYFFPKAHHISEIMTDLLHERTENGFVFRVDLDLRPEGKDGPLIYSREALMTYYEARGSGWERMAFLKARPVAGDLSIGEKLLDELEPFIYRRSLDFGIVSELTAMKEKINQQLKKDFKKGYHVKLGRGGIREIEFFVSSFQLVYGGQERALRLSKTIDVLNQLETLQLIPVTDAQKLRSAYLFLRRLENKLQLVDEQQTHTLPMIEEAQLPYVKMMGFTNTAEFNDTLKQHTDFVSECFEKLGNGS